MMMPEKQTAQERELLSGKIASMDTDEATARRSKRKLKNFWFEDGGRYLFRYGDNGSTVFDIWKWTGEPLVRRRA
jgi:hypothetical protein